MPGIWRLLWVAALLGWAPFEGRAADEVVSSIGARRFPLEVSGRQLFLPFEANGPIDEAARFSRLVIYIHGGHRQVKLDRALLGALGLTERPDTLMIIPQFLKDRDRTPHKLPDEVLSWAAHWEWGDLSSPSGMGRISSFEVVDRLIAKLVTRHSRMREVVVVGNSAGGQFTQRYAA